MMPLSPGVLGPPGLPDQVGSPALPDDKFPIRPCGFMLTAHSWQKTKWMLPDQDTSVSFSMGFFSGFRVNNLKCVGWFPHLYIHKDVNFTVHPCSWQSTWSSDSRLQSARMLWMYPIMIALHSTCSCWALHSLISHFVFFLFSCQSSPSFCCQSWSVLFF